MNKVYIDTELWYIENFLTPEEIEIFKQHGNDPKGWYKTMRSSSIRNKFIDRDIPLHPEGTLCPKRGIDISGDIVHLPDLDHEFPDNPNTSWVLPPIHARLSSVLPDHIINLGALQSFWPLLAGDTGGGAFDWHHEKGHPGQNDQNKTAAWSIYINDDFEGGVLEFLNKPYTLKPKPGMLVSIPMTQEWTHRVTPVTKGVRHTLYGVCYSDLDNRDISTGDNC